MKDHFINDMDINLRSDKLIVNEMFDGLFISTELEEEISENIHAIPEFQVLYYSVFDNKKGILKKFVREDLNLLIKQFVLEFKHVKVFELVIYLMFNINERIVKYLDDSNKNKIKRELENYVNRKD